MAVRTIKSERFGDELRHGVGSVSLLCNDEGRYGVVRCWPAGMDNHPSTTRTSDKAEAEAMYERACAAMLRTMGGPYIPALA